VGKWQKRGPAASGEEEGQYRKDYPMQITRLEFFVVVSGAWAVGLLLGMGLAHVLF
jgi:hypothetical protein